MVHLCRPAPFWPPHSGFENCCHPPRFFVKRAYLNPHSITLPGGKRLWPAGKPQNMLWTPSICNPDGKSLPNTWWFPNWDPVGKEKFTKSARSARASNAPRNYFIRSAIPAIKPPATTRRNCTSSGTVPFSSSTIPKSYCCTGKFPLRS